MTAIDWAGATRAQRRGFLLAIALAAGVRIAMLASKWRQDLRLNDSLWYSAQAVKLADGDGFVDPFYGGPSAEHGPLTPLLVAPVSWLRRSGAVAAGGDDADRAGGGRRRRTARPPTGRVVGGRRGRRARRGLPEPVDERQPRDVGGAGRAVRGRRRLAGARPGRRPIAPRLVPRSLGCGAAIGLAALARSELVLLAPLLAIVVWRARRGAVDETPDCARWRWCAAGPPSCSRRGSVANLVRFERPVLLTTNDGTTLLGANCDDAYYGSDIGGWSLFCVVEEGSPLGEDPGVRSARHRRLGDLLRRRPRATAPADRRRPPRARARPHRDRQPGRRRRGGGALPLGIVERCRAAGG